MGIVFLAVLAFNVLPPALFAWLVDRIIKFIKAPKGSEERANKKRSLKIAVISNLVYGAVIGAIIMFFSAALANM